MGDDESNYRLHRVFITGTRNDSRSDNKMLKFFISQLHFCVLSAFLWFRRHYGPQFFWMCQNYIGHHNVCWNFVIDCFKYNKLLYVFFTFFRFFLAIFFCRFYFDDSSRLCIELHSKLKIHSYKCGYFLKSKL